MANPLRIEMMHDLARYRDGRCLSDTYQNKDLKLTWQCAQGHIWDAIPRNIRKGSWCPVCAVSTRAMKSVKGSLDEMMELAIKKGGRCLSTAFIDKGHKLVWRCSAGHVWEALPYTIEKGHWCPTCSGNRKLTMEDMHRLAYSRKGKCLSSSYFNSQTKLTWQCVQGHVWDAAPSSIISGKWCAACSGRKKRSLEEMEQIAKFKGGSCLSTSYTNIYTKLVWRCEKGHVWEATPAVIMRGRWCSECSSKHPDSAVKEKKPKKEQTIITINQMHAYARANDGLCLSTKYKNMHTKITWQCKNGHVFEAVPNQIKYGSWCPECAGHKKLTLEDMHQLAASRGGECLSTRYVNTDSKILWRCADGHTWEASPDKIKRGSWCPKCQYNFTEERCRYILEHVLDKPFRKTRTVLQERYGYELDGYNEELNVAFEYHGEQHYEFVKHYHKTMEEFLYRQNIDKLKERLCADLGIKLLVIPYYYAEKGLSLIQYILQLLKDNGFTDQLRTHPDTITFDKFLPQLSMLNRMHKHAASKGGKCLATEYVNIDTKVSWKCAEGHIWENRVDHILNRSQWCPRCNGNPIVTLDDMHEIAASRNGKCLSTRYVNMHSKLTWQCAEGHMWDQRPLDVKRGSWCPNCGGNIPVTIQDMHLLATLKGGKCLSSVYVNSQTKLRWQCDIGHEWEAIPNSISRGSWCPICAGRLTIDVMQQIARSRWGECLSPEYLGSRVRLKWRCAEGHEFEATPSYIKMGTWCNVCKKHKKPA